MLDPAMMPTRAQNSGVQLGGLPSFQGRQWDVRNENVGIFGGPRGAYQRYDVSPAATDVLNKGLRSYNK